MLHHIFQKLLLPAALAGTMLAGTAVQQEVEKIVVAADDDNEYELETFAELED